MIQLAFIVLFCCSCVPDLLAQSGEPQKSARPCQIKELFNRSGWDIPGLSKAVVKTHSHYVSEGIPNNVFVDILAPNAPEASLVFISQVSGEAIRLEVSNMPIDVTQIERFTVNGHVFGYHVTGVDAGYDKSGKRVHFGYQENVYYYDPDGAGRFTVMRYDSEMLLQIIVPEWVKQTKKEPA